MDTGHIGDYFFDLNDIIRADNKIMPKNWNEVSPQRAETFQKYAEQIPALFNRLEAAEIQSAIIEAVKSSDNNNAHNEIISRQMSQVMQNIPQKQIGDVLKGINKATIMGQKNVSDSMLTSLLQRDDLSHQNLYAMVSCIQSKELLELYEQKLQKIPEAPEGSRDRMYQDKIKSSLKNRHKIVQHLETNLSPSQEPISNTTPTEPQIDAPYEDFWSEMKRVTNSSKTDSELQTNTTTMISQWQTQIGSLSPEEERNMSIALWKIAMEDKNNLHTDRAVENILTIAGGSNQKDNLLMLKQVDSLIAGAHNDTQLSVILSSIGNNMHWSKTGDAQTDFSSNLEKLLLKGMQNDKAGEKTLNVLATMLSNKQISETTQSTLRKHIGTKYESIKSSVGIPSNIQEQIDGKLKRYDLKKHLIPAEPTIGQRVGARIGESIDNFIDGYQRTQQRISRQIRGNSYRGKAVNHHVTKVKNKFNNGVNNVKTKVSNGVNKVKNFGKKVWKGTKTAAFVTAYFVASPVILPYKAAKWGVKKISNGVKAIRNGYKNLKNRALGITDEVAQDKDTAIKQTTTEKKVSRLNAQQVAAAWEQVRDDGNAPLYSKECDSHYSISGYADKYLEDLKSGKTALSPENAQLAATFLGISMEVQDKVNHNKVVDTEERNRNIAAQLEQFGIKNPYKTEETREQENQTQSQTPPAQEKPKEQEQPSPEKPKEQEIPSLNPEQAKLVESQLNVLKTLGQENGLKPTDDMYKGLVDMMERGFAEKGITAEQMGAIRESNPNLFPPKETEQSAPQATAEKPREAEQPAPQATAEKPREETRAPDPNNPESFNFAGITGNEGASTESMDMSQSQTADKPAPQATPDKPKGARKEQRDGRLIRNLQGLGREKQKSVKKREINTQILSQINSNGLSQ